jgi:hypothetical protein
LKGVIVVKEINQELSNLSKNLASFTVGSILRKHNVDKSEIQKISPEQKEELRKIAQNLEKLVNDYVSGNKESSQEEMNKATKAVTESPLRTLFKNKINRESDV